jgi:hypothetical protein
VQDALCVNKHQLILVKKTWIVCGKYAESKNFEFNCSLKNCDNLFGRLRPTCYILFDEKKLNFVIDGVKAAKIKKSEILKRFLKSLRGIGLPMSLNLTK